MNSNQCVCSSSYFIQCRHWKYFIIFGNPYFRNSLFLFLEMLEVSSSRHSLVLSQTLCGPGSYTCVVSTFFETESPSYSLPGGTQLSGRLRETVFSGTSSNRRWCLCNWLTQFPFCISRQLSLIPGCMLFCGWLGMKHYLCKKNKSKAYALMAKSALTQRAAKGNGYLAMLKPQDYTATSHVPEGIT